MISQDLNKLATRIFNANKAQGFWDKPRPANECFILCISELYEALECYRKPRTSDELLKSARIHIDDLNGDIEKNHVFKAYVKDTVQDEIADVFIRLLDWCGSFGYDVIETDISGQFPFGLTFFDYVEELNHQILVLITTFESYPKDLPAQITQVIKLIYSFAEFTNTPLEWHVMAKLRYNASREKMHGKLC